MASLLHASHDYIRTSCRFQIDHSSTLAPHGSQGQELSFSNMGPGSSRANGSHRENKRT
ncbi:hypothetical protein EI94DRAFT_1741499 [Lactarius quietus]|nr:hypothetical protein EI94DRAFT_1741499 [Lactarius quietus]